MTSLQNCQLLVDQPNHELMKMGGDGERWKAGFDGTYGGWRSFRGKPTEGGREEMRENKE
jgi:hypothetical protein